MIFAIIFGAVYPFITLVIWVVGTFGIAASVSTRRRDAVAYAHDQKSSSYDRTQSEWIERHYENSTMGALTGAFVTGLIWPVALPLYFAWKKGRHVDQEVIAREKAIEAYKRVRGIER